MDFFIQNAYAQGAQQQGSGSFIIMMVLMFAAFYFLLIRPQQKKQKAHNELVNALRKEVGQEAIADEAEDATATYFSEQPDWFDRAKVVASIDERSESEEKQMTLVRVLQEVAKLEPGEITELITGFVPAPPLSWDLRDSPCPITPGPAYPFGERRQPHTGRCCCFPEMPLLSGPCCLRVSGAVAPSAPVRFFGPISPAEGHKHQTVLASGSSEPLAQKAID